MACRPAIPLHVRTGRGALRGLLCVAVALSACTKTETVPFELEFERGGASYAVEVYVVDGTCAEAMPRPTTVEPIMFAMDGSWPEVPAPQPGQAIVVYATNEDDCTAVAGCVNAPGEGAAIRVVLAPVDGTGCMDGFMCCSGMCRVECADAGTDAGVDGVTLDAAVDGPQPADASAIDANLPTCESPDMIEVSVGEQHSCALTDAGDIYCWGDNESGQVDPASLGGSMPPTQVTVPGDPVFVQIGSGEEHICARTMEGAVYCWGRNASNSQNRLGSRDAGFGPHRAIPTGAADLSVGLLHSCAAMEDRSMQCWGQNQSGELGRTDQMDTTDLEVGPTNPAFSDRTRALAGLGNSCALAESGPPVCWGFDMFGAVGAPADQQWVHRNVMPAGFNSVVTMAATHTFISDDCGTFSDIGRFAGTTCGVFRNGSGDALFCWGANRCGQVGNGVVGTRRDPVQVGNDARIAPATGRDWLLAVGGGTTCVARRLVEGGNRELFCWGNGRDGQFLIDRDEATNTATAAFVLPDVDDVSIGRDHLCAIAGNRVLCWGANDNGKVLFGGGGGNLGVSCVPIP